MKISHEEGVAIHSAPSFALGAARRTVKRKQGNRWAGYRASKTYNQDADAIGLSGRQHASGAPARVPEQCCVVVDPRHA